MWPSQLSVSQLKESRIKPQKTNKQNKNKKSFTASTGFKIMTSAFALQCSTNWAMQTHALGAGQFIEFILTRERNETEWKWCELREYKRRFEAEAPVICVRAVVLYQLSHTLGAGQLIELHLHGHIFISFFITCIPQFTCIIFILCFIPNVWVSIAVGRALQRERSGHRFESRSSPENFFWLNSQLLKLRLQLRWSHLHFISFTDNRPTDI